MLRRFTPHRKGTVTRRWSLKIPPIWSCLMSRIQRNSTHYLTSFILSFIHRTRPLLDICDSKRAATVERRARDKMGRPQIRELDRRSQKDPRLWGGYLGYSIRPDTVTVPISRIISKHPLGESCQTNILPNQCPPSYYACSYQQLSIAEAYHPRYHRTTPLLTLSDVVAESWRCSIHNPLKFLMGWDGRLIRTGFRSLRLIIFVCMTSRYANSRSGRETRAPRA
ncbi:hypothetical protein V8E53_004796 [Lactarius tabidus]